MSVFALALAGGLVILQLRESGPAPHNRGETPVARRDSRRQGPVVPAGIMEYHPRLGWAPVPGAEKASRGTGRYVEYRINSQGLRDEETDYDKPAGEFRIVLLGDSNTFGFGVPIEKHYSRLLEGYFHGLKVVNLGADGFGIDQCLLFLREEGLKYSPDLVLLYLPHYAAHRHMHTSRWGRQKPRFTLEEDGRLKLENVPVPRTSRKRENHGEDDEENDENPEFMEHTYRLGEAILRELDADCQAAGAKLLVVTKLERVRDQLQGRVPLLFVSEALRNKHFQLPFDLKHMNEPGNGVLAWEITQFLRSEGLVPQR